MPELFGSRKAAAPLDGIFVGVLVVLAECARRRFEVLLFKGGGHVGGNQFILCHDVRLEPDTHRVVRCQHIELAHARDTFHAWLDVDLHVVVNELHVVGIVGAVQRHHL